MNRGLDRMRDVFDEARLFLSLPRPKPKRPRPVAAGSDRLAGICPPVVRHGAADSGHARRDLPAPARHHGPAWTQRPAFSSALLLSPRPRCTHRDLAGADRGRHRPRGHDHRRAPHLARPVRPRQGPRRHAQASDGPPPRKRRAVWDRPRRDGRRRRHRNHAVASQRPADDADGRGALGQSPRRSPVPGNAAPSRMSPETAMPPAMP